MARASAQRKDEENCDNVTDISAFLRKRRALVAKKRSALDRVIKAICELRPFNEVEELGPVLAALETAKHNLK